MCAAADLPTPRVIKDGITVRLSTFPIWMNVFDAVDGSSAKPLTASCAAAYGLIVLIARSEANTSMGTDRTSSSAGIVSPAAT